MHLLAKIVYHVEKAINYRKNFYKQFFNCLKNGRYCTHNSITKYFIRLLTAERKNSFFSNSII